MPKRSLPTIDLEEEPRRANSAFLFMLNDVVYALTEESLWCLDLLHGDNTWDEMLVTGTPPPEYLSHYLTIVVGDIVYTVQEDVLYCLDVTSPEWVTKPLVGLAEHPVWCCGFPQGLYFACDSGHGLIDVKRGSATLFPTEMDDSEHAEHFALGSNIYCGTLDGVKRFDFAEQRWEPVFRLDEAFGKATFVNLGHYIYVLVNRGCCAEFCCRYDLMSNELQYIRSADNVQGQGYDSFPFALRILSQPKGKCFYLFADDLTKVYIQREDHVSVYTPTAMRYRHLLNSPSYADVQFVVGGRTFHGHRAILSTCPVFHTMLGEGFEEGAQRQIPITDCTPEGFACLLEFLYSARLCRGLDPAVLKEVLILSDKYFLPQLTYLCEERLAATFSRVDRKRRVVCFPGPYVEYQADPQDDFGRAGSTDQPPPQSVPPRKRPDSAGIGVPEVVSLLEVAYTVKAGGLLYNTCVEYVLANFPTLIADPDFTTLATQNMPLFKTILTLASECLRVDLKKVHFLKHKAPEVH